MLKKIDQIDKDLSQNIHKMDSKILSTLLYPFARIFNPTFISIPISFMAMLCILKNKQILPLKFVHLLIMIPAITYVISLLTNLITVLILKKILKRPRPVPPKKGILKNKTSKLRGNEHNFSMPSGDSAQGAVFSVSLILLVKNLSYLDQTSQEYTLFIFSMIAFTILVCLSRVYFMCHYIGDTIVGAVFSGTITYVIYQTLYPILVKLIISYSV